jgi:adenine-specific DNA methylase
MLFPLLFFSSSCFRLSCFRDSIGGPVMTDRPRLIEVAFPLRQASLDSVHEKNVRHGHISTLHIWPARRPLAACRVALLATLLPDPGTDEERAALVERIGGKIVRRVEGNKVREETEGGVLHWGRENDPDMDWFREEIRKAYGGRAPRVLDPFAGGGAIPLEAMRLGCEVTAVDINPVAWFILKCTLEYPQKLAGQTRPLPRFALESREFMEGFFKGTGKPTKKQLARNLEMVQGGLFPVPELDLAWHVRAWGWWVLQRAREDLGQFYPVVDGKPTVAYLWARTVKCKNCRARVPLLKTRWLCKKENKRVLLTMEPNTDRDAMVFRVRLGVPISGGNAAQKREHDKRLGAATMSRSGAICPCCQAIMTWDDLRIKGQSEGFGSTLLAVVVDAPEGKEYRTPHPSEFHLAAEAATKTAELFDTLPFGLPLENTPEPFGPRKHGASLRRYGMRQWADMFTPRQLVALGTFVKYTRLAPAMLRDQGYPEEWREALVAYLCAMVDRLANQSSTVAHWNLNGEKIEGTFARFAFPIVWDFAEVNPLGNTSGGYSSALEWVALAAAHFATAAADKPRPKALQRSAVIPPDDLVDVVLTDPPYYDSISYADLMDFFYVWLRRTLEGVCPQIDNAFREPLSPKWDHARNDGELVDNPARYDGDRAKSKAVYEEGMLRAFQSCCQGLRPDGRLVIVFAHKEPHAWETLVSATIRAGFVVDGSWPIQTERGMRTRSLSSSALSSSLWLVCKKRPVIARPGWDNAVLEDMRTNIHQRLRAFWDAGIRGPDFVWAATGPALEAYSKHPVVKRADKPGELMSVADFLRAVRRIVVDFVVGRVLHRDGDVTGLDDLTTYYLLHRHDFGLDKAPVGACILYAVSCGLSDSDLVDRHDLLTRAGGKEADNSEDDEEPDADEQPNAEAEEPGSGSQVRLRTWQQRTRKTMGYDTEARPAPLIDQAHRLMHLWKAGDVARVDEYLDARGLRRNALFHQLLQALIELAGQGSDERALLESISNHVAARGLDRPAEPDLFNRGSFADE